MTMRPDPTFYASPKLAMEAPPENFAYTLLLSPDFSKPDALAVVDVKPGSPTFSKVVHTVTMPNKGDEFHHFGWNACSSALSPLTGHAFLERRYLIIPGLRSSRIYVVDTKPDPTKAKIHKIIEPEEVFKKTGYSRPHTCPLRSGRHLRQHARRRRQGWYRWATWRVHHGLRDV
jgi:selenium-binding protein 1